MLRRFPFAVLLLVAACSAQPMRWEKPGGNAVADETDCRAHAHEEAAYQLPYGDGPSVWSTMGMNQWKQEIDNERYYLARNLTAACMHSKGYQQVPMASKA